MRENTQAIAGGVDFFLGDQGTLACLREPSGAMSLGVLASGDDLWGSAAGGLGVVGSAGVMFVRSDSDLVSLQDIRGKSVALRASGGLSSLRSQLMALVESQLQVNALDALAEHRVKNPQTVPREVGGRSDGE
jgi:hypothetical protein